MIRFLFWPPGAIDWSNPYLTLYNGAMEKCGIGYDRGMRPSAAFLRADGGRHVGVHVHWTDGLWQVADRRPVRGRLRRFRRLAGFVRFLWAARRLGYRLVWTVHNVAPHEGGDRFDRVGHRLLARFADLLVFHSEHARAEFVAARRVPAGRTAVMRLGGYASVYPPPAPRADTLARLGVPDDRRVLLCPGLIRRYKGIPLAVEAAARLGPAYHLVVAGPPHDPELAAELAAAAGRGNVTVLPRQVTEQEFADLHHAADCVLLPYLKITGSSAVMAAVALGRGVVAADLPFFSEVIALEPVCGEVFPAGDVDGLAAAVARFFAVPLADRSAAALRLADRCSWDTVVVPLADRLRELVRTPSAAGTGGGR